MREKVPWFYYVGGTILRAALFLLTRWRVEGKENVPKSGALMVVSNHLHNADPPLVTFGLWRRARFMAKEELFRSRLGGFFVRWLGAFPVHRGRADREALRQAGQLLKEGQVLIMFPEGHRSETGKLQAAWPGAALIACQNGAPVLPVGITGTEKIKGFWWLHRPAITVKFGPTFRLSPLDGQLSKEQLAKQTAFMMEQIAKLLPADYRGDYSSTMGGSNGRKN